MSKRGVKKYLHLWKRTKTHRLNHVPSPIWVALTLMKARYNLKSIEDTIYMIIKRDPEAKEIIRYAMTGETAVRFKDDKTLREEIDSED